MTTLLLATRNLHKVGEIRAILGKDLRYLTLNDVPHSPEVHEDAPTFAGNAVKKSVELATWFASTGDDLHSLAPLFVLADDSGLEVDALNGAPGIHSARFASLGTGRPGNSPDADNTAKLLRLLEEVPAEKRIARFRCAVALTPVQKRERESSSPVCYLDELELQTEVFEGVCEGRLGFAPRGAGGFGYDPLFFPTGHEQTFAELAEHVKNQLSHRAKALEKLSQRLKVISAGA